MRTLAGRADLVNVLAEVPSGDMDRVARLIGYERIRPAQQPDRSRKAEDIAQDKGGTFPSSAVGEEVAASAEKPLAPLPFWRLIESEETIRATDDPRAAPSTDWQGLSSEAPPHPPLCPWPALMPKLRRALAELAPHREPDVKAIVRSLSQGQPLARWPRRRRRRWPAELQIIEDFATRLTPLWRDQKDIAENIVRLLPRGGVNSVRLEDGLTHGTIFGEIPDHGDGRALGGASILVMGDLGALSANPEPASRQWTTFARERRAEGRRCIALTPVPLTAYGEDIRRLWTLVPWDPANAKPLPDMDTRKARAKRLLGLLSHAFKIPPGLLRDVRRLWPDMSAVTEIDAWRSPQISSPHPAAATIASAEKAELHRYFREIPQARRKQIFELIKYWCGGDYNSTYLEAVLGLGALAYEVVEAGDLKAAIRLMRDMDALDEEKEPPSYLPGVTRARVERYFREMCARVGEQPKQIKGVAAAYNRLWNAVARRNESAPYPAQFDPSVLGGSGERRSLTLMQIGGQLSVIGDGSERAGAQQGSFLARIATRNNVLAVWPAEFWQNGAPPGWAADYGQDEFGPWVTFAVTAADGVPVVQRMRWIGPGHFMMGSPEDEPGRYESGKYNEGPRHEVRLTQGYWLFDTPVTQALWVAVTGANPSYFVDPKRPVEQVSWDDAEQFLQRINGLVQGLNLVLPTEAQWECACRAGTETATNAGPMEILGENNAPILDGIAWYGGNSGVGFELENGFDISSWPQRQYDDSRAGTHPVGLKLPNACGLYDMLGNVWEWCADDLREYEATSTTDPVGSLKSAERALRGGSWHNDARNVRAANRSANVRDIRSYDIGFRPARVRPGAEPAETGPGQAERQPAPARHGEARLLSPDGGQGAPAVELPKGRGFVVRSDCEILTFSQMTRPPWASAIGRDRHGLWTEFALGEAVQRLRWIAPGRFLMGSPGDEPGRFGESNDNPEWNEGPRHEVRLTKGYWLFDTPVTQTLWVAAMGENPSRFIDTKRPVEQVSWDDAQRFLERINGLVPGLDLVLPTEAQWEYACRAGTETATYAGPMEILGDCNAPVLDAIAWYGGNSGVGFELENGVDSSGWRNKQYDHNHAGTRLVGLKKPNDWGLYDMLGNVWEWCADGSRRYDAASAADPVGPLDDAERALRGGSWYNDARIVRAAYRDADGRDDRHNYFGFRPARVRP